MQIDRQNYEQYFMDYLDGKLNEEQVRFLMAFLEFNPDLKKEMDGVEKIFLVPDETTYDGKSSLFRSLADPVKESMLKDFDRYCIASLEHDNTPEEEELLQEIIREDPDRKTICRLYHETRLRPDETVVYPGRARLKKRSFSLPHRIILPAAAAAAAILIVFQLFTGGEPQPGIQPLTEQVPRKNLENPVAHNPPGQEKPSTEPAPMIPAEIRPLANAPGMPASEPGKKTLLAEKSGIENDSPAGREGGRLEKLVSISIRHLESQDPEYGLERSVRPGIQQTGRLAQYHRSTLPSADDSRLSLWFLADAGVRGLNKISEDAFHLDRKKDETGNTRRFTLDTPVFGISAPLRKTNEPR